MAGIGDFVLGGVAGRLVPALQTPVEDIIYEVLDQRGMPTRAEVRELRNKIDKMEASISDLTALIDGLRKDLSAAHEALASARAVRVAAPAAEGAAGGDVDATGRGCKVDGCDGPLRARGFCARHYQQWKRSTLDGFVNPDGTTVDGAVRYRVDLAVAGQRVETRYEGDEIIFFLPESGGRTLRDRVDHLRVDEKIPSSRD